MADLALVRTANGLVGATDADRELISKIKVGSTVHGDFKKMRNGALHRKLFALLGLAWGYWECPGGLVPRQEMRGILGLARYFEECNGKPGQLSEAVQAYIDQLQDDRAVRFPTVDKSREAFREHVLIESGWFALVQTPAGIERRAKSIAWSKMDNTSFSELYRDVFSTCWRLVLQSHFATEEEAMAAAEMLGQFS